MNVNDTEIAWSILQRKGYQRTAVLSEVPESSVYIQFYNHVLKQFPERVVVLTGGRRPSSNMFHKVR